MTRTQDEILISGLFRLWPEKPLGNTILPKNKTRGRVIPISLVAREIARDDV